MQTLKYFQPNLILSCPSDEQVATYHAALSLTDRIDQDLSKGIHHYRDCSGRLLLTLDQVIRAILEDRLAQGT